MKYILIMIVLLTMVSLAGGITENNTTIIIVSYSPYECLVGENIIFGGMGYGSYNGIVIDVVGSYIKTSASNKYINLDKMGTFELEKVVV